jgi:hypothetical protein
VTSPPENPIHSPLAMNRLLVGIGTMVTALIAVGEPHVL